LEVALAEAAALGITGRGALTTAGRALLAGDTAAAAAAMADRLPDAVDHVLVQADLTAVAPGPLREDIAAELAAMADVESTGAATVYRFSEASVRRALDAGLDAAGLHAFLARHSSTPVPQALDYLIDDVARRHGRIRTGSATSYLRADDPALVAEVLAHRATARLGLRQLAPTVLASAAPVARILETLRAAGYAPVAESRTGAAVLAKREARRVPVRARWSGAEPASFNTEQIGQLVRRVREGDAAPPSERPVLEGALEVLGRALEGRGRVTLGYLDRSGAQQRTVVQPEALGNGQLLAYDESVRRVRWFPLHRVTEAARVS
ncbi:MAG: helicase-associated domain-containing protein, partial [Mycobacteriales bacterium]